MQDLGTLEALGLASGHEACALCDSQIVDLQQTQELKFLAQWLRCPLKHLVGRAPHWLKC